MLGPGLFLIQPFMGKGDDTMTARLFKGVYGHELGDSKEGPFDLKAGQNPSPCIVKNGGWYNQQGEEIGWGSLSARNLEDIINGLNNDELFIVVPERHSSRQPQPRFQFYPSPDLREPGKEYVADKCYIIMAPGAVYFVDRYDFLTSPYVRSGIRFEVIGPTVARRIIVGK